VAEPTAYRLGIDFGTSNTVAAMAWPDGPSRFLLFDGTPVLPSAVCGQPSGVLLVGRDAVNAAPAYPDRFEPYPKRCVDDGVLLLGDAEVPVADAIAAVLRHVADEARRVAGGSPGQVVLTHPVSWSSRRQDVLLTAAARAGVADVRLVPEPVAAGHYFVDVLGRHLPIGGHLLVYDLGAGTFDASVLRRVLDGFTVQASHGLADAGGLDVDAAVMAHFAAGQAGRDPAAWARLTAPATAADRRHHRQAWDAVRTAKESLSRTGSVLVHLSALEQDLPLGREQLDALARTVLDRTVAATQAVLLDASVPPEGLSAVVLVGGASRTPLVSTLLHRALGIAPTAIEQPELVVAEGGTAAARPSPAVAIPSTGLGPATGATGLRQATPILATANRPRHGRARWIAIGAVPAVLALLGVVWLVLGPNGPVPTINPFHIAEESGGPSRSAAGETGAVDPVGASGQPDGKPTVSGSAPANRRAGAVNPPASAAGQTTSPKKSTGALGPVPSPRSSFRSTSGSQGDRACDAVGLRMTRVSGSVTTWPEVSLQGCLVLSSALEGGATVYYVHTKGFIEVKNSDSFSDMRLRYQWRLELRKCGGGLLESKDAGPAEKSGDWVLDGSPSYRGTGGQAFVRVTSLEVRAAGTVWTTSGTVTTPC
jgi:hypothetical protein